MNRIISPKNAQKIMKGVFWASGIVTMIILLIIIGYILIKGLPVINLEFLLGNPIDSGKSGGIAPMIVSTIIVTFVAVLVAAPIGVGAVVFIEEYVDWSVFCNVVCSLCDGFL